MLVKASEEAMAVREIEDGVDSNNSREINSIHLKQQHFVLVHGIGGGGWCWYKIKCLMENSGYKVSCIDLKSSGIDQSDADSILTFDDYNKPVIDFMSALPDNEQVILVGHSAGGLSITQACHKFANKVSLAVYVAATMLKFGYSTDEDLKDGVPDLSEFGDVYELGFGLGQDKPPTSALIKKELQRKIIYPLSPHEDSTLAAMLLRPGPLLALTRAQFIENVEVEKVPRVYIKTRQDNVVKPKQQEAMINRWPPGSVYELDSDHSPFFSTPFILFGLLVKAATFHVGCN
ncbi:putative carboxylesterase [Medicago truncatula]|uniref:Methylesterase n=1 Tax=Medicago truncatula TaxID=3880 RepID=A0A072V0H6_MEDTR|nr:methylesterase 17 isoform X1 [Medicago truncatula]XP_039687632.1 methylesterase 17 isoform X1 [Medicago truncatula]KEH35519.1 methylesterase [Medicago truncatula]RHN69789.1 putative carboxylesterase [Medicago truncatula]